MAAALIVRRWLPLDRFLLGGDFARESKAVIPIDDAEEQEPMKAPGTFYVCGYVDY